MKNFLVVLFSVLFLASVATATPIFIGSAGAPSEFDTFDNVQSLIDDYNFNYDPDVPDLGNWNTEVELTGEFTQYSLANIELDLSPYVVPYPVYVSFKYATHFDVWYVPNDENFDFMANLGQDMWANGLSHYRVWNTEISPVPEPATMTLLGIGLIGLSTISRKRTFKP